MNGSKALLALGPSARFYPTINFKFLFDKIPEYTADDQRPNGGASIEFYMVRYTGDDSERARHRKRWRYGTLDIPASSEIRHNATRHAVEDKEVSWHAEPQAWEVQVIYIDAKEA